MKLTAYTDESVFDELRPEWDELLHRSSSDLIFCTWEWQSTWWKAYRAGALWVVTCRDDAGQLVGIGSWLIQQTNGERVVRTIGCVDVTDYVDIIVDQDHTEAVQDAFAAFLKDNHEAFDRINLCNIPEASPTLAHFPVKLQELGFNVEVELQEVCPVIDLPDQWETYLERLDKKERHEIRRKMRRAEGEASLQWYVVDETCDIEAEVEKFLHLMRSSHPDKAKFLDDPHNAAFFKAIVPQVYQCGWLKMTFLVVNGTPSAAYCDFDYGNRIQVYNSGLLPFENAHLSPGIVLLGMNIRDAIEKKRAVFDFLRGNETYKYRMGAVDTKVFKLKARM
ncbi:MAG TPA: GNAT family N-acetyltransferase [Phototrophicaceae bacterium]|nr:GNAT family N-acetyltransferase [Phototrophicaceae bacterium]